MTTTELIELLKKNEHGGASGKSREVMFDIDDEIIHTENIQVVGTGDGLFAELFLSLPDAKKKIAAPHWIPVTERLPKRYESVLTTIQLIMPSGDMELKVCENFLINEKSKDWSKGFSPNVTAWMPLPEPWKGEQDEVD